MTIYDHYDSPTIWQRASVEKGMGPFRPQRPGGLIPSYSSSDSPIFFSSCARARQWRCWAHVPHWYFVPWVILLCSRFLSLKRWLLAAVRDTSTAHSFVDSQMLNLKHCLFSLVEIDWILKASILKAQLYPLIWPETARIVCVSERASWILISIQLYSFYASWYCHNPYAWQLFHSKHLWIRYHGSTFTMLVCFYFVGDGYLFSSIGDTPFFVYWRRYSLGWIVFDTRSLKHSLRGLVELHICPWLEGLWFWRFALWSLDRGGSVLGRANRRWSRAWRLSS